VDGRNEVKGHDDVVAEAADARAVKRVDRRRAMNVATVLTNATRTHPS
jgi:hypothetical protein